MKLQNFSKTLESTPRISQEKLVELAKRVAKGDRAARSQIIESNMGLVMKIAGRNFHKAKHLGPDDIIQQGAMGLIHAVDRYDPYKINPKSQKPYRFSTYAVYWIEYYIQQALHNQEDEIHVPFERLKESGFDNPVSHSLDDPQVGEQTLTSILESPEHVIEDLLTDPMERVRQILQNADLTGLEREILKLSSGLVDGIERSNSELAAMLGCDLKAVNAVKRQARQKAQNAL